MTARDGIALDLGALDGIAFRLDREGRILDVGCRHWRDFAEANGAPGLTPDAIRGRSVYDFILGEDVREQVRTMLERLSRRPDATWVLPYRCDAPDLRRDMRLSVRALFDGDTCIGFLFQSIELDTQPRPSIPLFDFRAHAIRGDRYRGQPHVMICSWCQRVQYVPLTGAAWISAEAYYAAGGSSDVGVSHGICEECLAASEAAIESGIGARPPG